MYLVSAKVGPFKSINSAQTVPIDSAVTVLVGMNEAGKTVFLQALEKSNDVMGLAEFDPVDDFPRKDLSAYLKKHDNDPANVTELTYGLTDEEVSDANKKLHAALPVGFTFTVSHYYNNGIRIGIAVDERPVLKPLLDGSGLSSDATAAAGKATNLRGIPEALKAVALTETDKAFLAEIEARMAKTEWNAVVSFEAYELLKPRIPKFLYFGDYDLLPSKMNLADLTNRVEQAKSDPKHLKPEHRGVMALLRMADIAIGDFSKPGGYEPLKAKIEAVSISLTDQIMAFWKQNEDLEVEIDIKADSDDEPPFNNGPNLYLRIKNRRHRGVSTPFRQRSRGFIWFFSFLVWFDSVQHQIQIKGKADERGLILLLDEPGLSLHALAQADFLRYIDDLAKRHQVLYSTHSPFMVHSDRLGQVRTVEDTREIGTVISDNISSSDPRTTFPLQAALGWSMAQNLFISERNLLVEGTSELAYLQVVTSVLEAEGLVGLRQDITIVPTGGLDKVATFIALLGASGLKLVVLHDYRGAPEQRLLDLVRQKMIAGKLILDVSQFRDLARIGKTTKPTDIEDLFPVPLYLEYFNRAFPGQFKATPLGEADLAPGDRVVERIERFLQDKKIMTRPSGGFNHYTVASAFASHPPAKLDPDTLKRFEELFAAVNALYT